MCVRVCICEVSAGLCMCGGVVLCADNVCVMCLCMVRVHMCIVCVV
jgi:hypothetical protein